MAEPIARFLARKLRLIRCPRIKLLTSVAVACLLSQCMSPVEFGTLQLQDKTGVIYHGWYGITAVSKPETRKMRLRFFVPEGENGKEKVMFDRTYSFFSDSTNVERLYHRDQSRMEVRVRNKDGSTAFSRAFGLVGRKAEEVAAH